MFFHRNILFLISLLLTETAQAAKGKTEIQGCVFFGTELDKNITVKFGGGSAVDRCMKQKGGSGTTTFKRTGLFCASIGQVEVNDDGSCYYKNSNWGMSYEIDGTIYSGATSSKWTTGPFNSDITLEAASPGTNICGTKALCSATSIEWANSSDNPIYIIFRPQQVAPLQVEEELK